MTAMEDDTPTLQSDMGQRATPFGPDAAAGSPESLPSGIMSPSTPPAEQHGDAVGEIASPEHLSLHMDSQEMCCSQAMSSQGVDSTLAMMLDLGGRDTGEFESQGDSAACPASEDATQEAAPAPAVDAGVCEDKEEDDAQKENKEDDEVEEVAPAVDAGQGEDKEEDDTKKENKEVEEIEEVEEVRPRADTPFAEHVEEAHDSEPSTCPGLEVLPQQAVRSGTEADATDAHMDDSFLEYLRRDQKERHPELEEEEALSQDDLFAEPARSLRHHSSRNLADAGSMPQPGISNGVSCSDARPLAPGITGSQDSIATEGSLPSFLHASGDDVPRPAEASSLNSPVRRNSSQEVQSADDRSTVDVEDRAEQTRALLKGAVEIVLITVYRKCNPDKVPEVPDIVSSYSSDGAGAMYLLHEVIERYVLRQFPEAPAQERPLAEQASFYKQMLSPFERSLPDSHRLQNHDWPEASSCEDLARAFKRNFAKLLEPCITASGNVTPRRETTGKRLSSAMGSHSSSSSSGLANAEDTYEQAQINERAFASKFSEVFKRQRLASIGRSGAAGAPADLGAEGSRCKYTSDAGQAHEPSEAPGVDQKATRSTQPQRASIGTFLKGFL